MAHTRLQLPWVQRLFWRAHTLTRSKHCVDYGDNYWLQPSTTIDANGQFFQDGRIPVELFKFSIENDWAVLIRKDGKVFTNYAEVDISFTTSVPTTTLVHQKALLLHFPVALINSIGKVKFREHVNTNGVVIQSSSSHHVHVSGSNTTLGSFGGALHLANNPKIIGMHTSTLNDEETDANYNISNNSKRSVSEHDPYPVIPQKKSRKQCGSDTLESLCCGSTGQGAVLIIAQFKKLVQYLKGQMLPHSLPS